ncbi:MAG: glycosyltransferase family 2 protein [Calditrichaeota bacterium]|nr:glycosyltransferase family 2 protein [Calditrichota bacterium]
MKLIIQIPCYNEEATLPVTLQALPKSVPGVDELEVLVIDDGSTDRTVEVARAHGVNHIVRLTKNKGLAEGFMVGLDACLKLGADIIVNTDADNQYCAADIETLIRPILEGKAEMVIGDRQINGLAHVPFVKKKLQLLGSWVVRQVSGTSIPDATSGFRAMSRDAALRLNVVSNFTYTLETIIQAGKKNIALAHVPVRTNSTLRESRLFKSIWAYVRKSMGTIFRIYTMYEPLRMFLYIGSAVFGVGVLIGLRFLYFYLFAGKGSGHIQSLILAAILIIVGFQVFMIGLLADLIGANRRLIEEALYRIKKTELTVSGKK